MFLILLRNPCPTMLSRPPSAPLLSTVCTLHQRARTPRRRQQPLLRQASLSLRYPTVTHGEWLSHPTMPSRPSELGLHDDDNTPCYVKHHSPHATSRSRMVNGMIFTTSPPSTSRYHRRHPCTSVLSSIHQYYVWRFLLQFFLFIS